MTRRVAFTSEPLPSTSSSDLLFAGLTSGQQRTKDAFEDIINRIEGRAMGEAMKGYVNL